MLSTRASIPYKEKNGLPYFERTNLETGHKLTALIDTGAANNYISLEAAGNVEQLPLSRPITIKTVHGNSKISSYILINIFSHDVKFLVLKDTGNFDLIFGMNGLQKINAILDFITLEMSYTTLANRTIDKNLTKYTKPTIKKRCRKNRNTKRRTKTNARTNDPTISKWGFNKSGTRKTELAIDNQKLNAQTILDSSKGGEFPLKINRNSKLPKKKINITRNRPSNRIDKTKPKFKMKQICLKKI